MRALPQPWIGRARTDILFILMPPIIATAAAWLWSVRPHASEALPPLGWLLLIVMIDVAHVYATLFRTYLDPEERLRRRTLCILAPLLAWLGGMGVYSLGEPAFWRVLAYLAAFHFVRQQYGFVRLYSRREGDLPRLYRRLDAAVIYAATLYPLIYWHAHGPRAFSWFMDGDFLVGLPPLVSWIAGWLYVIVLASWLAAQAYLALSQRRFNAPKTLVVAGTAISWYTGIVALDGDVTFTLTNVVAHGIPYMALVWTTAKPNRRLPVSLGAFFMILIALAYAEEGLWDGLVWQDHPSLFPGFAALPSLGGSPWLLVVVPLLCVPQVTHYALDGFIWKLRGPRAMSRRDELHAFHPG